MKLVILNGNDKKDLEKYDSSDENLSSNLLPTTSTLVTTSNMDLAFILKSTTSLHPTNSSLLTTGVMDATTNSGLDITCSLAPTTYDEER